MIFGHRKADLQETFSKDFDPGGLQLPYWIKLERIGNSFTAQHSPDGVHWEAIEPDASSESNIAEIEMNDRVYIGLAVSSGAGPHVAAEAKIANVRVTGVVTPTGPFTVSKDIGSSLDAISTTETPDE